MKILIVGCGGREHAIARALKSTPMITVGKWYNPGMPNMTILNIDDPDLVADFAQNEQCEMAIIGSEQQLAQGLVDKLQERNVFCIGPTQALARVETDKGYARSIIPAQYNPQYYIVDDIAQLPQYINALNNNYVIKPVGLTGGKGVKVSGIHLHTLGKAQKYAAELLRTSAVFLLEERLIGREFIMMSFADGITTRDMPIVIDYKRLEAGDLGPNTGSMGCVSYANGRSSFLKIEDLDIASNINKAVLKQLPGYQGILYGSFIKTVNGHVKVIEYNARFGDPEVINVLELLKTDLLDIFLAIRDQRLADLPIHWEKRAVVSNYLVAPGYPERGESGHELVIPDDISVIFGKVQRENGKLVQLGSRSVAVSTVASTVKKAYMDNKSKISRIRGNFVYRSDIGEI